MKNFEFKWTQDGIEQATNIKAASITSALKQFAYDFKITNATILEVKQT